MTNKFLVQDCVSIATYFVSPDSFFFFCEKLYHLLVKQVLARWFLVCCPTSCCMHAREVKNCPLKTTVSLLNLNVVRRQHANSNFHDSAGNTKTEAPTQSSPRYKIRTRVPRRGNKKSRVSDTFGRTRNTDRLRTCRHIERG